MAKQDPQFVITGKVRLSYTHLFKPYAKKPGDDPKFSATLLIPKNDVATKQKIDAAINAAVQEGPNTKWNGVRPPIIAMPIYDGDGARPSDGMPYADECKGHWVMSASCPATRRPEVVDINLNPIINESEVYSGVYARVSIRLFPYNNNGKKGIGCGLNNVQKLEDGTPLGGGTTAASDFGGFAATPITPGYVQPAYPQQQPQVVPTYQQPVYQQPQAAPNTFYQQPVYPQPQVIPVQQPQAPIDPITGKPILGAVMGL